MKNFLQKSLIFISINLLVLTSIFAFLLLKENHKIYENWQTKSNLLVIPENADYDLLIMGGSQGKNLSIGINHINTEKILDKKVLNIARHGGKGGIKQQNAYLQYFYGRNNKAKKILYFITVWNLYSLKFNENNLESFDDEPFSMHFLINLLKTGINNNIILHYIKFNFANKNPDIKKYPFVLNQRYVYNPSDKQTLIAFEYSDGTDEKNFKKHSEELIETVKLAQQNNSEIIFVISTTLIDDIPGINQVKALMQELKYKYNVSFYDYSRAISEQNMYRNIDHLNSEGSAYFAQNYLKPILDEFHEISGRNQ